MVEGMFRFKLLSKFIDYSNSNTLSGAALRVLEVVREPLAQRRPVHAGAGRVDVGVVVVRVAADGRLGLPAHHVEHRGPRLRPLRSEVRDLLFSLSFSRVNE